MTFDAGLPPTLSGPAVASQHWRDVAFLHWRVDPVVVQPLLPAGVTPDTADGSTWVGLIGFELARATLASSPAIPYFGTFAEVNVRLYAVDAAGRRGVVFLSLEAARLAAVLAARTLFSLPYFWSRTSMKRVEGAVTYAADRIVGPGRSRFTVASGDSLPVQRGLEEFLTARWGLFTEHRGRTVYLPNTHERWPLFAATLTDWDDSLIAAAGITVMGEPESVLFSPGVHARFGPPEPVGHRHGAQ